MALPQPVKMQKNTRLEQLLALAATNRRGNLSYAGDIASKDAYEFLSQEGGLLVDVRTAPEWQAGVPDIASTAGSMRTVSWKFAPDYALNPDFASGLADVAKDTPVFFLCRSGGRSLDAAVTMTQAGFHYCFNIDGGFENDPAAEGSRSKTPGWRASKLPWKKG